MLNNYFTSTILYLRTKNGAGTRATAAEGEFVALGLDTMIQEGGRPLSSGEKQLVCIARAFAFNPDLIIFDEATSYMDSQSEQKVHDAMNKLMRGRLAIIIAHRLSTVKNCDTILLLRDGKIKERGSHQELVKLQGEYYHLLQKERIW